MSELPRAASGDTSWAIGVPTVRHSAACFRRTHQRSRHLSAEARQRGRHSHRPWRARPSMRIWPSSRPGRARSRDGSATVDFLALQPGAQSSSGPWGSVVRELVNSATRCIAMKGPPATRWPVLLRIPSTAGRWPRRHDASDSASSQASVILKRSGRLRATRNPRAGARHAAEYPPRTTLWSSRAGRHLPPAARLTAGRGVPTPRRDRFATRREGCRRTAGRAARPSLC